MREKPRAPRVSELFPRPRPAGAFCALGGPSGTLPSGLKHLTWILVGAVVTVFGLLWLDSMDADVTSGGGVHAVEAEPEEPLASGPAADPPARAVVETPTGVEATASGPVQVLAAELRSVIGRDASRERVLLGELVRIGTEPALEEAIAAVEDPRSVFFARASANEALFRGLSDRPLVHRYAQRALEGRLVAQENRRHQVGGFHRLIAKNGGEEGARTLLEHLGASTGDLSVSAAEAALAVTRHEFADEFLAALRERVEVQVAEVLAASLVGWGKIGVTAAVYAAALEPTLPVERRAAILRGLGPFLDGEHLPLVLELLRETEHELLRAGALEALRRVRPGEALSREELVATVEPFVLSALAGDDEATARGACRIVEGVEALRGPTTRAALESLRATAAGALADDVETALRGFR